MRFTEITATDFRKFAKTSPYASFMQTPEIAKLREKDGWTVYYFAVTEQDETRAAAMVVAKPTFLGKSTFICPGGPLMDYEDTALVSFFLKSLKDYAKTHNGYTLQISPYYELTARDRDGEPIEGGFHHQKAVRTLEHLGFTELPHASQPKYMFAMDLADRTPDELLADFKRNTRNHIKKAEKSGVTVRELRRDELGILKQITESTSKRRGFTDRPLTYYETMYDLFADRGEVKFLVAEVPLEHSTQTGDGSEGGPPLRLGEMGEERAGRTRPAASDFMSEKEAFGQDPRQKADFVPEEHIPSAPARGPIPLSAAMFMLVGFEVVYLFSGSDEKYMKEYNAQYLIQWEIIKYAAEHGFKRYNFYGIHDLPKNGELDGIYEFKKGFDTTSNAHVLEFLGTFEAPVNSIFFALHKLLKKLKT